MQLRTLLLRTIQRLNDELTPKKEQELLLFPPPCLTFFSIEKNRIWQNSTTKLFFLCDKLHCALLTVQQMYYSNQTCFLNSREMFCKKKSIFEKINSKNFYFLLQKLLLFYTINFLYNLFNSLESLM